MNNKDIKIEEVKSDMTPDVQEESRKTEERLRTLKMQQPEGRAQNYLIPLAIVVAAGLVGAALYFGGGGGGSLSGATTKGSPAAPVTPNGESGPADITFRPIGPDDHIRGDPNAPIALIEYSDTECPFCKRVHPTLQQLVQEYDGKVKWVYRHFPLDQLHSKARKEAEATECANELGGNDAFWAYVDKLFEVTPSNDGLDPAQLPKIAEDVGLERAKFEACLSSGKYAQHVADDLADAQAAGGNGTPYSIVIGKDGTTYPISGAQPYTQFTTVVEQALR